MLSEEQFSSCVEAQTRLGVLEKVPHQTKQGGLLRLKVSPERIIPRVLAGEFGEFPEGDEVVPWFSCVLLKGLLEEKGIGVSKEEFTAMASVITGFMAEAAVVRGIRTRSNAPVIRRGRERRGRQSSSYG